MTRVSSDTIEITFTALQRLCSKTAIAILLLVFACAFVGCDSEDDGDDDNNTKGKDNGSGQAGTEDETDRDAGNELASDAGDELNDDGVSLSWPIILFDESLGICSFPVTPLEGVEVCLIESIDIPCAYTDDQGIFVLQGVPKNRELLLTFNKQDYDSYLALVRTGTANIYSPALHQPIMVTKKYSDELWDRTGVAPEDNKGAIILGALNETGLEVTPGRLSISIDPPVDDGPFFLDKLAVYDPNAIAVSTETPHAGYFNLDEGEYLISWEVQEPDNMTCSILGFDDVYASLSTYIFGLPAAEPNTLRIKVRAGFTSQTAIMCTLDTEPDAG